MAQIFYHSFTTFLKANNVYVLPIGVSSIVASPSALAQVQIKIVSFKEWTVDFPARFPHLGHLNQS
jgi:hypothetical protein